MRAFCLGDAACAAAAAPDPAIVRAEPTPDEAESYLSKFRLWLANFPFVHLAPDLSAAALRKDRPFLWRAIMNITHKSLPQQYVLRDNSRQELADCFIINNERSMDLLLGLICYLGWYVCPKQ